MDTNKIKKGLGRGLSSLIGETKPEIIVNKLLISDLVSNKFQPRKIFEEVNLSRINKLYKRKRNDTADHSLRLIQNLNMKL